MTAMGLNAVYKVLHHSLTNFITQKVIICEDVPHGFSFQELNRFKSRQPYKKSRFLLKLKDSQDSRLEKGTWVKGNWKNPVCTSAVIKQ